MAELWYNLGLWLYNSLITLAAPFHNKAKQLAEGRAGSFKKLESAFAENDAPVAWFHCASLGEFEQSRPLIEQLKTDFPQYKVLLTFFSPSGYEVRKNYPMADHICYLPPDTAKNAQKFISLVKPSLALFAKYEFWYHYTKVLHEQEIPLISFSTIFRKNHPFFRKGAQFYRDILKRFDHFFVQDTLSGNMLKEIGIRQVEITGDTRFDRVFTVFKQRKQIEHVEAFTQRVPTFIIGSSWPADIEVMAEALNSFEQPLKLIVAPHEISEGNVAFVQEKLFKRKAVRLSQWADAEAPENADLLIIDNMGMLSSLYGYGQAAYVGGGFGKGLHNTLEPATYGIPVIIGKKFSKFREAVELTAKGGAFPFNNAQEFKEIFHKLFTDETFRKHAGQISGSYVKQRIGATQKILDHLRATEVLQQQQQLSKRDARQ